MAQGVISAKYLYDIAEAIRVKSGSQSTVTPAQMAAAIANIDGTISGTITPSTDTGVGVITDTIMAGIADAIRAKLDVQTQYSPSQMADAILSITSGGGGGVTIVSWASGSDSDVAAMIDAAHAGTIDLQQDGGWAVGDVRTISIAGFTSPSGKTFATQNAEIVISSFAEYNDCGNVMQFDFKTILYPYDVLNITSKGTGNYANTDFITTIAPMIVNAMPDYIKNRLIEFTVYSFIDGSSSNRSTATGNKLALRARGEVQNGSSEGGGVEYYGNSSDLRKKSIYGGTSFNNWWLRTSNNSYRFYYVNNNGSSSNYTNGMESNLCGYAPFGCL